MYTVIWEGLEISILCRINNDCGVYVDTRNVCVRERERLVSRSVLFTPSYALDRLIVSQIKEMRSPFLPGKEIRHSHSVSV